MINMRFASCLLILTVVSCTAGKNQDEEKIPVVENASLPKTHTYKLSSKSLGENGNGIPSSLVILEKDGKPQTIDTIHICEEILPEQYADHSIPANALSACGGWYAGAGDYFYLVTKNAEPVIYYGWQDEMQEDRGFHWKKISLEK